MRYLQFESSVFSDLGGDALVFLFIGNHADRVNAIYEADHNPEQFFQQARRYYLNRGTQLSDQKSQQGLGEPLIKALSLLSKRFQMDAIIKALLEKPLKTRVPSHPKYLRHVQAALLLRWNCSERQREELAEKLIESQTLIPNPLKTAIKNLWRDQFRRCLKNLDEGKFPWGESSARYLDSLETKQFLLIQKATMIEQGVLDIQAWLNLLDSETQALGQKILLHHENLFVELVEFLISVSNEDGHDKGEQLLKTLVKGKRLLNPKVIVALLGLMHTPLWQRILLTLQTQVSNLNQRLLFLLSDILDRNHEHAEIRINALSELPQSYAKAFLKHLLTARPSARIYCIGPMSVALRRCTKKYRIISNLPNPK